MNRFDTHKTELDTYFGWACELHEKVGATYDGYPYSLHIRGALTVAREFSKYIEPEYLWAVIKAVCFHDVLEDCGLSYNDLSKRVGKVAADIVYSVTNELGKTRYERNFRTYPKIRGNYYATFVKLCDRIANVRFSLYSYTTHSMYDCYKKEYPDFRNALKIDGELNEMWEELDRLMEVKH